VDFSPLFPMQTVFVVEVLAFVLHQHTITFEIGYQGLPVHLPGPVFLYIRPVLSSSKALGLTAGSTPVHSAVTR
jgi:hypothetical protein